MTDQGEEEFERVKGNELLNIEKVHGDFPREGFLVLLGLGPSGPNPTGPDLATRLG